MQPGQVVSPGQPDPNNVPQDQGNDNEQQAQPAQQPVAPEPQQPPEQPQPTEPAQQPPVTSEPEQAEPQQQPPPEPQPQEATPNQPVAEPGQPEEQPATPEPQQPTEQPPAEEPQTPTDSFDSVPPMMSWQASEYMDHTKTSMWYIGLGVVALGLAVFLVLVLGEWLSAAVVVLMAVSLGVYGGKKPRVLQYSLSETGVSIGNKFYPYEEFRGYALVHSQGLETIELDPIRRFMPRISVFFEPDKGDQIIDILDQVLPREERAADAIDKLSQKLKF